MSGEARSSTMVKARILTVSVLDIVVDLLLPTLIYLVLAPTGRSAAVRLTVGGFAVAAKSVSGQIRDSPRVSDRRRQVVTGVTLAVVTGLVTLMASAHGVSDTGSIIAGTVVLGVGAVPQLLRSRSIDGFALLVLVEVAMSVVLVTVSSDPRFILVRPAFYTAVAGVYALITCWTGQPFMMTVSRPMAAGGDERRGAAFDRAWTTSPVFRRIERLMTFGLGAVLLAEAALRVTLVYSRPPSDVFHASLISQLPGLALFVGYLIAIRIFAVPVASREVDRELAAVTDTNTNTNTNTMIQEEAR